MRCRVYLKYHRVHPTSGYERYKGRYKRIDLSLVSVWVAIFYYALGFASNQETPGGENRLCQLYRAALVKSYEAYILASDVYLQEVLVVKYLAESNRSGFTTCHGNVRAMCATHHRFLVRYLISPPI